ncbi:MAG: WecB/TagA/CpsF family glycosyltransferase [Ilumatobacteraceae bacterium]
MVTPCIVFGVPVDGYTNAETLDRLGELVDDGRRRGRAHQVATVNVDFLVNAVTDPTVLDLLQGAELNLADGMPLVWASRLLGTPLPERVAGADLVPSLARASAERGWKVHLFGAGPGVAERARAVMLTEHPDASITAEAGPERIDVERIDDEVVQSIRAVAPDVLCVALGNPKQERFIATYRAVLGCPVMIGIGGSLDMLVGDKERAPEWAQRAGVEWVFRAAQEPRRLGRRYLHDILIFGPRLLAYWRSVRRFRSADALRLAVVGGTATVTPSAVDTSWPDPWSGAEQDHPTSIDLQLSASTALTPAAHARLIGLVREARMRGVAIRHRPIPPELQRCFEAFGTWEWLSTASTTTE